MGAVFEAENTVTLKRVALKWMHPQLASDPDAVQRFTREAQASARIRHPNVVDVYDILQEGDAVFMVMELLEGESLGSIMLRRGASVPAQIGWLLAAMRGVAKAHKQGVVHRDIKPDNIFLAKQEDGTFMPKVLDFGISKVLGTENLSLTRTGAALGTPLYMSLEQLTGVKDIDERTDVYAFGVILYETVTGQLPFQGETLTELAVKIATTEPPPPKAVQPTVPTELEQLILWAMTKKREERLPTLDRFVKELEPFADEATFSDRVSRHAASLPLPVSPHAATSAGRVGDTTAAAAAAAVQARSSIDGDPITLPVRRQPIALYAGIGVVLIGAASAWGLAGGSKDAGDGANVLKPAAAEPGPTAPIGAPETAGRPEAAGAGGPAAALTDLPPATSDPTKRDTDLRPDSKRAARQPAPPTAAQPSVAQPVTPAPAQPVAQAQEPARPAPAPAARPAAAPRKPAEAAWTPIAMPRRSVVGGIFGSNDQASRRKTMLQIGPPHRSVAAAKRAYSQRVIDEQTYEDNIWVLKIWRAQQISDAKQDYESRSIDKAQYKQRIAQIDAQYEGR